MWYLQCLNDSLIYLWEKDIYSVGRKNKDIIIANDDSISRNHGVFKIKNDTLYLMDLGSKYGTFIGSDKVKENEEKKLRVNNVITFGLLKNDQSKFIVKKLDFKVVLSNVKSNIKHEQYTALDFLKISRQTNWDKFCTHVIVSEVILTSKILCALTMGQNIVNVNFFPDFVTRVKTNAMPPEVENYTPVFNETLLNKNIKLDFHPGRKTLFKDLTFVFLTEKSKKNLEEVISTTGGNVISWQKQEFGVDNLKLTPEKYLFIEDINESINKESKTFKSFLDAIKFLKTLGRRPIPLQEIALAIIHNSREENCNSKFNRAKLLLPERTQEQKSEIILAYDTEHSSNTKSTENDNFSEEIPSVVEPSFDSINSALLRDSVGVKRSLEVDLTQKNDENSSKKAKEDLPSVSKEFSFRKTTNESTQSITKSRLDKFLFPNKNTAEKSAKPDEELVNNPFSRKRKASNNLSSEPKKRPLENISNTHLKIKEVNIQKKVDKVAFKDKSWLSTSWIKKELSSDEIKIKKEEPDEEISKILEMFKDTIIIEYCPIVLRKTITQNISTNTKNFKIFKKVHQNYQSEIISVVNKVVVGDENICPPDEPDDEMNDDDINSFTSLNSSKSRAPARRRFQFCV